MGSHRVLAGDSADERTEKLLTAVEQFDFTRKELAVFKDDFLKRLAKQWRFSWVLKPLHLACGQLQVQPVVNEDLVWSAFEAWTGLTRPSTASQYWSTDNNSGQPGLGHGSYAPDPEISDLPGVASLSPGVAGSPSGDGNSDTHDEQAVSEDVHTVPDPAATGTIQTPEMPAVNTMHDVPLGINGSGAIPVSPAPEAMPNLHDQAASFPASAINNSPSQEPEAHFAPAPPELQGKFESGQSEGALYVQGGVASASHPINPAYDPSSRDHAGHRPKRAAHHSRNHSHERGHRHRRGHHREHHRPEYVYMEENGNGFYRDTSSVAEQESNAAAQSVTDQLPRSPNPVEWEPQAQAQADEVQWPYRKQPAAVIYDEGRSSGSRRRTEKSDGAKRSSAHSEKKGAEKGFGHKVAMGIVRYVHDSARMP